MVADRALRSEPAPRHVTNPCANWVASPFVPPRIREIVPRVARLLPNQRLQTNLASFVVTFQIKTNRRQTGCAPEKPPIRPEYVAAKTAGRVITAFVACLVL